MQSLSETFAIWHMEGTMKLFKVGQYIKDYFKSIVLVQKLNFWKTNQKVNFSSENKLFEVKC